MLHLFHSPLRPYPLNPHIPLIHNLIKLFLQIPLPQILLIPSSLPPEPVPLFNIVPFTR